MVVVTRKNINRRKAISASDPPFTSGVDLAIGFCFSIDSYLNALETTE
jgi:hypothetical protein